tara:strand:- start:2106 stop:2513 length:408 start_codon:yes stop_codon:yes gene_type:complete
VVLLSVVYCVAVGAWVTAGGLVRPELRGPSFARDAPLVFLGLTAAHVVAAVWSTVWSCLAVMLGTGLVMAGLCAIASSTPSALGLVLLPAIVAADTMALLRVERVRPVGRLALWLLFVLSTLAKLYGGVLSSFPH